MSEERCAIAGCDDEAHRRVSRAYIPAIQGLSLGLKGFKGRKIPLCKKHYKLVKKAMRALRRAP